MAGFACNEGTYRVHSGDSGVYIIPDRDVIAHDGHWAFTYAPFRFNGKQSWTTIPPYSHCARSDLFCTWLSTASITTNLAANMDTLLAELNPADRETLSMLLNTPDETIALKAIDLASLIYKTARNPVVEDTADAMVQSASIIDLLVHTLDTHGHRSSPSSRSNLRQTLLDDPQRIYFRQPTARRPTSPIDDGARSSRNEVPEPAASLDPPAISHSAWTPPRTVVVGQSPNTLQNMPAAHREPPDDRPTTTIHRNIPPETTRPDSPPPPYSRHDPLGSSRQRRSREVETQRPFPYRRSNVGSTYADRMIQSDLRHQRRRRQAHNEFGSLRLVGRSSRGPDGSTRTGISADAVLVNDDVVLG